MTLNVTALLKVRELLGWSQKAVEFTGDTLDRAQGDQRPGWPEPL